MDGNQHRGHTPLFATKRFYAGEPRTPMDDLESLVYSIWYIGGIAMVRDWESLITEGRLLKSCTKKQAMVRILVSGDR